MNAIDRMKRYTEIASRAGSGAAEVDYVTIRDVLDELDRLRTIVDRINPEADGNAIDARDAAWNLFAGRVSKDRAREIWPWLAEYEAVTYRKMREVEAALSAIRFRCLVCGLKTDCKHIGRCVVCGKNQWEALP